MTIITAAKAAPKRRGIRRLKAAKAFGVFAGIWYVGVLGLEGGGVGLVYAAPAVIAALLAIAWPRVGSGAFFVYGAAVVGFMFVLADAIDLPLFASAGPSLFGMFIILVLPALIAGLLITYAVFSTRPR